MSHEHPLVWQRQSGRNTMLIGYTADSVVGMSQAGAVPRMDRPAAFTRQAGDLVIWDKTGALHRVVPYAVESGRRMHRTSVAGVEAVV